MAHSNMAEGELFLPEGSALLVPIARIHTDYSQKFGIPRQSGLAPDVAGRIVFEPEFSFNKAVAGLEGFSHLWLLWRFENGLAGGSAQDVGHDVGVAAASPAAATAACPQGARQVGVHTPAYVGPVAADGCNTFQADAETELARLLAEHVGWAKTVRPPRLGGSQRKGVFATRSPFRPNPVGLSCVRLDRVELTSAGPVVHVLGADLRDGTPIFDIKPYVPYADCQPQATGGFTDDLEQPNLQVEFPPELLERVDPSKRRALAQVLSCDPRPVGKEDPEREYALGFAGMEVVFRVHENALHVIDVKGACENG